MISLTNINKYYCGTSGGGEVVALRNVSFSVKDGQVASVVGPSGCGKTTLLNIIAGVDDNYRGEISFTSQDRGRVGYMFQTPSLLPWRTVWDNVIVGCELAGRPKDVYEPLAEELLARYGLTDFARHYPNTLSQGMQQRVSLIRLVLFDAQLWLLDEPFSRLDSLLRRELYQDLLTLVTEQRITTILVTHDLEEAITFGDKVILLSHRPGTVRFELEIPVSREERIDSSRYLAQQLYPYLELLWKNFVNSKIAPQSV